MREQYQEELDQMRLTQESKDAMVHRLLECQQKKTHVPNPRVLRKSAVLAAAAACVFVGTAGGVLVVKPVLQEYYGDSAGYEQSVLNVGQSISKGGWTVTVTDCVWDNYNVELGITLTAPEGTVLDAEKGYDLEGPMMPKFPALDMAGSSHYIQKEDENPEDNILEFVLSSQYCSDGQSLAGQTLKFSLHGLYHLTQWNEQKMQWEREYDCREVWHFQFALPEEDYTIHLTPNIPVHTLDVDATLTQVNVSPFGVYATIEGDALKGHHAWVPMNAPDGWYGCIDYQEVTAWTTDGTAIALTDGLAGSGCSGGHDRSEPGWLQINRRFDELVDVNTLDHITICGVDLPLQSDKLTDPV